MLLYDFTEHLWIVYVGLCKSTGSYNLLIVMLILTEKGLCSVKHPYGTPFINMMI